MHIHAYINQSFNDLILPDSMTTASISPIIKYPKGDYFHLTYFFVSNLNELIFIE